MSNETIETIENINQPITNDEIDLGSFDPTASDKFYPADPRPGTHVFSFHLQTGEGYEKEPFEVVERGGAQVLRVNYKLSYEITNTKTGETYPRTLNFQRADFYQSEKMKAKGIVSDGARLIAALGLNPSPFTEETVKNSLREADNVGTQLKARTGVRFYDKETKVETTTNPGKDGTKVSWPRNEKGEFVLSINNSEGKRVAGNAFVVEFQRIKG